MTRVLGGRSSELEELHDVANRARAGGSATLVIWKESGVGKTVFFRDRPGTSLTALEAAEALKLMTTDSGIEFRHPLVRSVATAIPDPVGDGL